jgi:LPS sulfotransferase NodH
VRLSSSHVRLSATIPARTTGPLAAVAPRWFAQRVRRPYFIIGCGRSGTTLLNDLFEAHPEVAVFPSEANEWWHPRLYPWHVSRLEAPPFFVDARQFTDASLHNRTEADDLKLKAAFGAFQTFARKPVFLNKTVMVTFMVDKILELFPDAHFIHLYRDGRAVALSWVKKDARKLRHPRYLAYGLDRDDSALMKMYISHWQDHIMELERAVKRLGLRDDGRYHEMSYERLCSSPAAELARLADFMKISSAPFVSADLSRIRNMNEKARGELTDALATLTEAGREGLSAKGYGPQLA